MSMKYLGPHFDIHMGGVDNIFPHHENEIAQSECANGVAFVNYWLHCQHLIVDGMKMSKSLGNFYTLDDLLGRGYAPMAVRYLLLSTHYRKLLNFTLDSLEMAGQALARVKNFVFSLRNVEAEGEADPGLAAAVAASLVAFSGNLADDFNVSGALGVMFDLIAEVNPRLNALTRADAAALLAYMERINAVLGVLEPGGADSLDAEIEARIALREKARQEKDFARADEIRAELKKQGIVLMDTPAGVKWKKE
jgi:cysteinyl-tRNA synthetase